MCWRGAAPIQRAIATGDTETGITIMKMAAGLDTGDMMYKTLCPITATDTSATLHDKLAVRCQSNCWSTGFRAKIARLFGCAWSARWSPWRLRTQTDESRRQINWSQTAAEIDRNIRAFSVACGVYPLDDTKTCAPWGSALSDEFAQGKAAGTILKLDNKVHTSFCDQQAVCLSSLQWPGAKPLNPVQIIQTQKLQTGTSSRMSHSESGNHIWTCVPKSSVRYWLHNKGVIGECFTCTFK